MQTSSSNLLDYLLQYINNMNDCSRRVRQCNRNTGDSNFVDQAVQGGQWWQVQNTYQLTARHLTRSGDQELWLLAQRSVWKLGPSKLLSTAEDLVDCLESNKIISREDEHFSVIKTNVLMLTFLLYLILIYSSICQQLPVCFNNKIYFN